MHFVEAESDGLLEFESTFTKEDYADIKARLEVFEKLTENFTCELGKVSRQLGFACICL